MVKGFEESLLNVQRNYEDSKKNAVQTKENYEKQLFTAEKEHDDKMVDMQLGHLKTEEEKKKKVIEENLKQREALKAMEEAREKLTEKRKLYNEAQKEKDAVAIRGEAPYLQAI